MLSALLLLLPPPLLLLLTAAHVTTSGIFAALAATLYFRSKGVQPRYVPHEVYRTLALPDLQLQVRADVMTVCSGMVAYWWQQVFEQQQ
jgi:hypothetical protein